MKNADKPVSVYFTMVSHQLKWMAQTGRQQPNMSTTFMGRSRPLDDVWRQTPRSAEPAHGFKASLSITSFIPSLKSLQE